MAKKEPVEIVVIVDRSGSMQSIKNDAIGGFNTFLKDQQAVKGAANLTLVLFDHEYLVSVDAKPVKDVESLTEKTYVPRGSTAMNDAIGRALAALEAKNPKKAIVCILTDGQENCSREFSTEQAKAKIKAAEARGWQVTYLSADANAFANGAALGINAGLVRSFTANSVGTQAAYASLSTTTTNYRAS